MSSAFRNAVKRKTHKERSQPAHRSKLGLLEKKKDYRLRAADYHKKQKTLQVLRQKAEFRNDDEFYRAMDKVQTRNGVHVLPTTTANKYSQEELRLMKTQDIGYLALKAQVDAKKLEKLEQSLHRVDDPVERQHVRFVDDVAELASVASELGTATTAAKRGVAHAGYAQWHDSNQQGTAVEATQHLEPDLQKCREDAYRQLQQRKDRLAKLQGMVQHMELQRALMGPGAKMKHTVAVDGKEVTVFKWRQERQR